MAEKLLIDEIVLLILSIAFNYFGLSAIPVGRPHTVPRLTPRALGAPGYPLRRASAGEMHHDPRWQA